MTSAVPARASRLRGARALFTGRSGGVSAGGFAALNLARQIGDDDGAVTRNRELLAAEIGARPVFVEQVHSAEVHTVPSRGPVSVVRADAMVTDRRDVALSIMVADCLPVLLADAEAGVIAAAHAGRRGLLDGVLGATVAAMAALGARPERMEVAVGPSICGRCYEVPTDLRDEAAARVPETFAQTSWGTPSLDLRAGAAAMLKAAGVRTAAIDLAHPCTLEDEEYFSYRRDHVTGRFAGVVRREPSGP